MHISSERSPYFSSRRSFWILFGGLLLVLFFESRRIEVLVRGNEESVFSRAVLGYAAVAETAKQPFRIFSSREISVVVPGSESSESVATSSPSAPSFTVPAAPYTVLIAGDSFIADRFGIVLERKLHDYEGVTVRRDGVYSTGLSRPDYFNWNEELKEQFSLHAPNVVIVMFGANDGQNIVTEAGEVIIHKTAGWKEAYAAQVRRVADFFRDRSALVFWIGNPIASSAAYTQKINGLNAIYQTVLADYPNAHFISTWDALKNERGEYAEYLRSADGKLRLARSADGIHVTDFGAQLLAGSVLPAIEQIIPLTTASSSAE